jgi:hypothetical protein
LYNEWRTITVSTLSKKDPKAEWRRYKSKRQKVKRVERKKNVCSFGVPFQKTRNGEMINKLDPELDGCKESRAGKRPKAEKLKTQG